MLALIMAGGAGSRLNLGEKPLLLIAGSPMLSWIVDAFTAAGCETVIVTTTKTPMTRNWCRARGLAVHRASGAGFIEDMTEAVMEIGENKPLFISVSDIPCISADTIQKIRDTYDSSGREACSVWVPARASGPDLVSMPYRETVGGIEACPAGVNILKGDLITDPQDEEKILCENEGLAINVNTQSDRSRAEEYLRKRRNRNQLL